jgi:hypothetical protein
MNLKQIAVCVRFLLIVERITATLSTFSPPGCFLRNTLQQLVGPEGLHT